MRIYYCPNCNETSEHEGQTYPAVEVTCPHCGTKFHTTVDNLFDWSEDWKEESDDE